MLSIGDLPPFELLSHDHIKKAGIILPTGQKGEFDESMVESPDVFYEPTLGCLVMIYTAYKGADETLEASHGYAVSQDGVHWTKKGRFFTGSGMNGTPDSHGVTGPTMVLHKGKYYLFYIGLTRSGYEGGTKSLCLAVADSFRDFLEGRARRLGAVMRPGGDGWHQGAIWHPDFLQKDGIWYCLINCTGVDGRERTGYATASRLEGPWTLSDKPLLDFIDEDTRGNQIAIDPSAVQYGPYVVMSYGTVLRKDYTAIDEWCYTTMDEFPMGWRYGGVALYNDQSYDSQYAHKPFLMKFQGRIFHYYTAVGGGKRQIGLAY